MDKEFLQMQAQFSFLLKAKCALSNENYRSFSELTEGMAEALLFPPGSSLLTKIHKMDSTLFNEYMLNLSCHSGSHAAKLKSALALMLHRQARTVC
jgi:hypothetical protein